MRVSIMATSGGAHPADKFAEVTANKISDLIELGPDATVNDRLDKQQFELNLTRALSSVFDSVQKSERAGLRKDGSKRLAKGYNTAQLLGDVMTPVLAAVKGTSYEAAFSKPESIEKVKTVIAEQFTNALKIERSWHADKNPNDAECKAFKARRTPAPAETPVAS